MIRCIARPVEQPRDARHLPLLVPFGRTCAALPSDSAPHLSRSFIRIRLNHWNRTQTTDAMCMLGWMEAPQCLRPRLLPPCCSAIPSLLPSFVWPKMARNTSAFSPMGREGVGTEEAAEPRTQSLGHKELQERLGNVAFYSGQHVPR